MEPWLRNSKYLNSDIWEDSRKIYFVNDTYSKRMKVGGYWRSDSKSLVTLFTLPKAGHSALRGDVVNLMSLIGDYMTSDKNKGLQCHAQNVSDCKTSVKMCLTMNGCNQNGYCQQGQCVCSKGWSGADCGQKTYFLTNFFNKQFVVNGTQAVLFEYREGLYMGERYELTISSQQPMDVYLNPISASNAATIEPSEFNYIAAMKKQTYLKISSDSFPQLPTFGV
jgi:hypothetical protein